MAAIIELYAWDDGDDKAGISPHTDRITVIYHDQEQQDIDDDLIGHHCAFFAEMVDGQCYTMEQHQERCTDEKLANFAEYEEWRRQQHTAVKKETKA